ncbi:hypothetical protein, partial [Tepidiforma sp.]|uniref:helix-turn-helix transcriptional regulator n=1 Tax=Tepidiforma sp. TaxID=2682230 RepID=UPI002ADE67E8
ARRLLLLGLKQHGESDAEALAAVAFLSVPAVRAHLAGLARLGLVEITRRPSGPGRPRNRYALTPRAEALFPQGYARLAEILLEAASTDPATRRSVFRAALARQLRRAAEILNAPEPRGRLEQLKSLFETLGYYPVLETEPGGRARLILRHCPFIEVASGHPEICEVERQVIQLAVPGGRVERTCSRSGGAASCAYSLQSFR